MFKTACYEYGERYWKGILDPNKENGKYKDCGQATCPSLCPTFKYDSQDWFGEKPTFFDYPFSRCGLTDRCIEKKSQSFDPTKRDIDETYVDPYPEDEGWECAVDDNGQKICVNVDALADAAMDLAGDIAGDIFGDDFGFGGSSEPEEPKGPPPPPPKNYKDGWECAAKSDCKSGCCSSNFDIEVPTALDTHVDYDLESFTLEQKLTF